MHQDMACEIQCLCSGEMKSAWIPQQFNAAAWARLDNVVLLVNLLLQIGVGVSVTPIAVGFVHVFADSVFLTEPKSHLSVNVRHEKQDADYSDEDRAKRTEQQIRVQP